MLLVVVVAGTVAYASIGLSVFDGFYQTVITITTVGYSEVGATEEIDRTYRAVTVILVLVGAGSALYTISVVVESIVEGGLDERIARRRMQRVIDRMSNHVIVAGWGRVGRAITHYVRRHGAEVVVIDRSPHDDEADLPVVVGEATDDTVLTAAGLDRASVLIAALDTDADNLYVTLTARSLRDDLFIVVRTNTQANEAKFYQAGADRVVNPHEIGGSRMGALAMQPHVAEFLDEVLHDETHDVAVHEILVGAASSAVGKTVAELSSDDHRALVIAIRKEQGEYLPNPPFSTVLDAGDVVISLGSANQLAALRRVAGDRPPGTHTHRDHL